MARRHAIPEIWRYRVNGWRYGLALAACIDGATQRSDDAMADAGLAGSGQLASGRFQWRTAYQRCTGRECLPIGNGFSPAGCVVGEVATGRLEQVGARGVPVAFELRLRDCLRSRAASRDERTGILSWAPDQPAVRVSFSSRADRDNPQLVKAQGGWHRVAHVG